MKKILFSIISVIIMIFMLPSVSYAKEVGTVVAEGTCGKGVSYVIYDTDSDGEGDYAIISGSGEIKDNYYSPFGRNSKIRTVEVKEGITRLGDNAFYFATKLSSVSLPNSLKSIGKSAFDECVTLPNISIPDGVTEIGEGAFINCKKLEKIVIPSGVSVIENSTFNGCDALASVSLPKNVTKIGMKAFDGCVSLTNVVLPEGVTDIEERAFYVCKKLVNINIPSTVKVIGESAFSGCESLKSISLPSGLTKIVNHAFTNCKSFTSINIPGSVEYIGDYAFEGCENLKSVTIEEGVEKIGTHAFEGCYVLDSVTIPRSVKNIGGDAFFHCSKVLAITGYEDSEAERYAEEYGIKFNALPAPAVPSEQVKSFVGRLYTVALGRAYDEAGLNSWAEKLASGTQTGAEVAQGFFFSAEFINKNLSDSDYVDTLYRTMFDREADEVGKADWLDALANGMSREFVYRGFAEGAEFKNLCDSFGIQQGKVTLTQNRDKNRLLTAFVARNYTKALGRPAEEAGINDWTGRILGGKATPADVTAGFIFSSEFTNKNLNDEDFLKVVYQTYFDREPDTEGYNYWIEKLKGGVDRKFVVNNGFSNSQEFKNLVERFGL